MKERQLNELLIRAAALFVLMVAAWKCTAQDFRINTAAGLVTFAQSDAPDEICFSFGVEAGELKAEHLGKTAKTLPARVAAAARMANDAGVRYPDFCRENAVNDSPAIQEYYRKCRELRRQFLAVMPERVFIELQHITQRIEQ
jgi:hypothetical protein